MEANAVSIDQPASSFSLQPVVFTVPAQRSDMSQDLVTRAPILASAGRTSVAGPSQSVAVNTGCSPNQTSTALRVVWRSVEHGH